MMQLRHDLKESYEMLLAILKFYAQEPDEMGHRDGTFGDIMLKYGRGPVEELVTQMELQQFLVRVPHEMHEYGIFRLAPSGSALIALLETVLG